MKNKIILSFLILIIGLVAVPVSVDAATSGGVKKLQDNLGVFGRETGLGQDDDLKTKIASVINIALGFLGMLATIMIIYAGFKWLTAAGNEDQVTKAKETLRNAVIGIAVIFLSFVIVNFVVNQLTDTVGGGGGGGAVPEDPGQPLGPRYSPDNFTNENFVTGYYKFCNVGTGSFFGCRSRSGITVCTTHDICGEIDAFEGLCTSEDDTNGTSEDRTSCRDHFIIDSMHIYPE